MTPGMKSSEFWLAAVMPMAMVLMNQWFGWGLTPEMMGAGALGSGSYAVSRGLAKKEGDK